MTIGKRIRARRRLLDLSQAALAAKSGVHVITLVRVEGGRTPSVDTLQKLAHGLGMPASELLDDAPAPQQVPA